MVEVQTEKGVTCEKSVKSFIEVFYTLSEPYKYFLVYYNGEIFLVGTLP